MCVVLVLHTDDYRANADKAQTLIIKHLLILQATAGLNHSQKRYSKRSISRIKETHRQCCLKRKRREKHQTSYYWEHGAKIKLFSPPSCLEMISFSVCGVWRQFDWLLYSISACH